MSADNWATCPKCVKVYNERTQNLEERHQAALRESYGQQEMDDFIALTKLTPEEFFEEEEGDLPDIEETKLREDYEIETSREGEFSVSYRSRCYSCGYEYSFSKTVDVFETNPRD